MIRALSIGCAVMFLCLGFTNDDGWQTIACWALAVASLYVGTCDQRGAK